MNGSFQQHANGLAWYRNTDHTVNVSTENEGAVTVSTSDGNRLRVTADLRPRQARLAADALRRILRHETGLQRWATGGHLLEIAEVIPGTVTVTVRHTGLTLGIDVPVGDVPELADALDQIADLVDEDTD